MFPWCSLFEIILFVSSLTDVWVGLSDTNAEEVYQRVDGFYPEWAEWMDDAPDGGVQENCVLWSYTRNAYMDVDCTEEHACICEYFNGEIYHLYWLLAS